MGKLGGMEVDSVEVGRCGRCGSVDLVICFDVVAGDYRLAGDAMVMPLGAHAVSVKCRGCGLAEPLVEPSGVDEDGPAEDRG